MAADFTIRGDTKLDGSGFSEGLSRMGNLAAKGLKVVGVSLAAAGVAVGALAKQSLDAYSDYEQMVGGVKTLFGTEAASVEEYAASVGKSVGEVQGEYDALVAAQNKVFADAKNASKDAGMSANAYMQTVTSFSARLLQGLGGDSQKAAEIANMAVVDMSDNVNKMGSSMTDVQNAYQGFAKQNYTMLDNLKLGYGGTQAEMARLINDSGVLGDTMTVTAETVNNVSFDKIIEAIHTIQTKMGITGTTAKEASTTIAGSVSQMSAAWTNWLTALADPSQDLSQLTTALLDSIVNVGKNVVPRLMEILPALGSGLVSLASGLVGYIPGAVQQLFPALVSGATSLLQGLAGMLPGLITSAFSTLPAVFSTLLAAAPGLASAGMQIVRTLGNAITQYGPTLMQNGLAMIQQLGQGLVQGIPTFLAQAYPMLLQFTNNLRANFGQIVSAGIDMLLSLAQGWISALPTLIAYVPQIVTNIAGLINDNAPKLLTAGLQLIAMLGQGLVQGIPTFLQQALPMLLQFTSNLRANFGQLVSAGIDMLLSIAQGLISSLPILIAYVPQIVTNIAGLINDNAPKLLTAGLQLIGMLAVGLVQAIPSLVSHIPQIIQAIVAVITAFNWLNLGSSVMQTLGNGIRSMAGAIKGAVTNGMRGAIDFLKGLPAQAIQWGKDFIGGLINGIKSKIKDVVGTIGDLAGTIASQIHFSRPDTGPLRYYERWMPDFMQGLARGVRENAPEVTAEVARMAEQMAAAADAAALAAQTRAATEVTVQIPRTGVDDIPWPDDRKGPTPVVQNINFNYPVQAPDEVAREIRIQNTYGLGGDR